MLALADLLVYLQVILLFQEKDQRVYWWLAVMSLLQVVVAARFSQAVWFGVLLVVYMMVGLCALDAAGALTAEWNRHRRRQPGGRGDTASAVPKPRLAVLAAGSWSASCASASRPAGSSRAGMVGELFARLALIGRGHAGPDAW